MSEGSNANEQPKRTKSPRASRNAKNAEKVTAKPATTKDGKPVRKTASGFTVVG